MKEKLQGLRRTVMHTLAMVILSCPPMLSAENVDPYQSGRQYTWSENTGWLNAEPSAGDGMHVEADRVTGWVWGENIGWINLSCENNGACAAVEFGVTNNNGKLSGYAWGENVGWINFDPDVPGDTANLYRVSIDTDGKLSGWAWGENIGWIHFDSRQDWDVQVCRVTLEDLTRFAADWLEVGAVPGNLDEVGRVDLVDFERLAHVWQTYCPHGWLLK